ncbi:MAG: 5'-methylthioadenosine nucleosidase, partial [Actinomycetota bacterium]
ARVDGVPAGLPFAWHAGSVGGLQVAVTTNGVDPRHGVDNIATQPAALNTYVSIDRWAPDLVLTAGTAGGWAARGADIGDVYLSGGDLVFHDRRIGIPAFDEYGHGRYPTVDAAGLAARLALKTGVVTTSNSLDDPEPDRSIMRAHGADVKEMEAAAVGWVTWLLGVPVMAVKAITDLVDHHTETAEQFQANLAMATDRLSDAVTAVLSDIDGRTIAELA